LKWREGTIIQEYYEYYLTLHQDKWCRRMHFIGQLVTIGYVAAVVFAQLWWLLLVAPFVIYPFAWSGHLFFEKNKPPAWSNPFLAKVCDWLMFRDILLGRIKL